MDTRSHRAGVGRSIVAATAFLTRLPIDRRGVVEPADITRGVVVFPAVGALIGGCAAGVAWTLGLAFPAGVAAVGAVAAEIVVTGGFHLDGLADTGDGYGGTTRERVLEIMRDHSIGTYGAAAIVVDLLLKTVVIAGLIDRPGGLWTLVAAGAVSRAIVGVLGIVAPYARPIIGIGGVLSDHGRPMWAGSATVLGLGIAWAAAGVRGLIATAVAAGAAAVWTWSCRRRLGGMTGDTLGASVEGTTVIVLLVGLAFR
jgi:cobalamin 5'-phosphate synthase/cobalamin synthase